MVAIATGNETAHGEICVDILARRSARFARQAILNEVECLKRNQPIMLPLSQRQIPVRHFEIANIERLGQDLIDALTGNQPVAIFGK